MEYITRHIELVARSNIVQFFGVHETYNLLGEWLDAALPADVAEHIRAIREDRPTLLRTSRQLQGLLNERVPLTQTERLAQALKATHSIADAVECRRVLRDSLRDQLWGNDGEHVHYKLSDSITAILDGKSAPGERFAVPAEDLSEFFTAVRMELHSNGQRPALVIRGERLRYLVRHLIRDEWQDVPVLADSELINPVSYDNLPTISLE